MINSSVTIINIIMVTVINIIPSPEGPAELLHAGLLKAERKIPSNNEHNINNNT